MSIWIQKPLFELLLLLILSILIQKRRQHVDHYAAYTFRKYHNAARTSWVTKSPISVRLTIVNFVSVEVLAPTTAIVIVYWVNFEVLDPNTFVFIYISVTFDVLSQQPLFELVFLLILMVWMQKCSLHVLFLLVVSFLSQEPYWSTSLPAAP